MAISAVLAPGPAHGRADPGLADPAIIVTARKREEALDEVPQSVAVLSRMDLERRNVTTLQDVQRLVPNLTLAPAQNVGDAAGNAFIRGIGQEDFAAGADPGVAIYLDGVYMGRTMGALGELVDVERIEVLRGPQGTLYGRNTIGGAINIVSRQPELGNGGQASLLAASRDRLEQRATVNLALDERWRLRLAAGHSERDGYVRRLAPPFAPTPFTEIDQRSEGADERWGIRAQLRWLPRSDWTIDLAADFARRRGTQTASHLDAVNPGAGSLPTVNRLIRDGFLPGPQITAALVSPDLLESHAGGGNRIDQDQGGLSLVLDKAIGAHHLRLSASYRHLNSFVATDSDGTWYSFVVPTFSESYDQAALEAQASGPVAGGSYVAGVTAFHESARLFPVTGSGADVLYLCGCLYTQGNLPRLTFPGRGAAGRALGIYAQGSVPLSQRLSMTLGARYSRDRKRVDGAVILIDPVTLAPTDRLLGTGENAGTWAAFTWRAGIEFRPVRSVLAYASAARGFKSGGFNVRPVSNLPNLGLAVYDPEFALSLEAGLRARVGSTVTVSATAFTTDYRGIQLRQQTVVGQIVTTLIENAARARIQGLEFDAEWSPLPGVRFGLTYGHVAPRYLDVGKVPNITLGSAFQRTPRHTFALTADLSRRLRAGVVELGVDYGYRAREQFQLVASPWDQPGYGLLSARLSWRPDGANWTAALFGTNLADVRYRTAGRADQLNTTGFAQSKVGAPRQVGVQLSATL